MVRFIKNSKSKGETGVKGIVYRKKRNDFLAKISYYNSKTSKTEHIHVGNYKTLKEAKKARIDCILKLL
jgi:hypothetical protein